MSGLSAGARHELADIMHAGESPRLRPRLGSAAALPAAKPVPSGARLRGLAQRVEIVAAASSQWQRTVAGRLFPARRSDDRPDARAAAVERIAQTIRARIRQSDAVVEIGPAELAVCLSLVADERDLAG